MDRLGEIVEKLEAGDLPLEQSLSLFEEGVRLSKITQQKLDAAELKVEQLLAVEDGRARTAPFGADDDDRIITLRPVGARWRARERASAQADRKPTTYMIPYQRSLTGPSARATGSNPG